MFLDIISAIIGAVAAFIFFGIGYNSGFNAAMDDVLYDNFEYTALMPPAQTTEAKAISDETVKVVGA